MNLFSILGKYVTRQLLANFFMVFFAILGVILMFDGIESLRRISGRDDVTLWFAAQYAVTRIAKTVEIVFPFVLMVAAMITFWRLSKNNEFVVIRSTGISIFSFLKPLIIITFILGLINITLFNPVAAKLHEWHEVLSYRLASHNPNAMLFSSKGLWIRESIEDNKVLLIQAKTLRQEPDKTIWMRNVSITELNQASQITKSYEAYFATLEGNVFHLKDVKVLIGGQPVQTLSDYAYETNIDMQRIKENFIEPDAISFWQLPDTISFYERAGFSARQHWMRYLNLLISPFFVGWYVADCRHLYVAKHAARLGCYVARYLQYYHRIYHLLFVASDLCFRQQRLYSGVVCGFVPDHNYYSSNHINADSCRRSLTWSP